MRQLLLDLDAHKAQTLDSFVVGNNTELLQRLTAFAVNEATPLHDRFIYLWGESGSGKTHLLRALRQSPRTRYLDSTSAPDACLFDPGVNLYLVDDCDRLSPQAQIAIFALFNEVRENGAALVTSGALPPAGLNVREDLRTRLGWGLVYQVHELTDEEKIAALSHAAHARGLILSVGVLPYLITHFRRDMRSLSAMLEALDRYSLETQRPITLPLLRELLQQSDEAKS
jgi:DnaA family protein